LLNYSTDEKRKAMLDLIESLAKESDGAKTKLVDHKVYLKNNPSQKQSKVNIFLKIKIKIKLK
jgi:hypothetical protein